MIDTKRWTPRASCPVDTHRPEPPRGASLPASHKSYPLGPCQGLPPPLGAPLWQSALFSNISSSFFCRCLLDDFCGSPWGSSRRAIPTSWTNPLSSSSLQQALTLPLISVGTKTCWNVMVCCGEPGHLLVIPLCHQEYRWIQSSAPHLTTAHIHRRMEG